MILEAASRDKHICTPDEWTKSYYPMLRSQVNTVQNYIAKFGRSGSQNPAPTPVQQQVPQTLPPMVNNPAGIPITLGKHGFNKDDLHIPESKRRRSTAPGASSSPTSTVDPGTGPPTTQTPLTMGTPSSYPVATPSKRPLTDSPASNKVQSGPAQQRDRAQEEALARRKAKERAEEQEREEVKKNSLKYAQTQMYRAFAVKPPAERSPPSATKVMGVAEQRKVREEKVVKEESSQKQLPSPPSSVKITPRQLAETFSQVVDVPWGLTVQPELDDWMKDLFGETTDTKEIKEEEIIPEDSALSPLGGDSGSDEAYSWTRGVNVPWNGDMNSFFEQTNNLGVAA
jgi:hypothetical protein